MSHVPSAGAVSSLCVGVFVVAFFTAYGGAGNFTGSGIGGGGAAAAAFSAKIYETMTLISAGGTEPTLSGGILSLISAASPASLPFQRSWNPIPFRAGPLRPSSAPPWHWPQRW